MQTTQVIPITLKKKKKMLETFLLNMVRELVVSKAQNLVAEQVEELIPEEHQETLNSIVDKMDDNSFNNVKDFLRG